jgi:hypothetical protein
MGLDDRGSIADRGHHDHSGSGANSASYSVGTGGSYAGDKAIGA